MDNQAFLEFIGYIASVVIAISLLMKSLIRLRIINGIGALIFVVYGIAIQAYPVAVLNGIIVLIDTYYLLQMMKRSDYFTLMKVTPKSSYLTYFLNFHNQDMQKFFPDFSYQAVQSDLIFFVLRNTVPAGLVILRKSGNVGTVILDYALKDYRDLKIGSFIFDDNADFLRDLGIEVLEAHSRIASHINYLQKMGFKRQNDHLYTKKLPSHLIRDTNL